MLRYNAAQTLKPLGNNPVLLFVFVFLGFFSQGIHKGEHFFGQAARNVSSSAITAPYIHLPLAFEPNEGQTNPQVKFLCRGKGYAFFITPAEVVLCLRSSASGGSADSKRLTPNSSFQTASSDVIRMRIIGGNRLCKVEGLEKLSGISNYFIGNDSSKWRKNISQYAKVRFKSIYPGVDVVYYGNSGKLEYDFELKPGTDPKVIRMKCDGVDNVSVDGKGNLLLTAGSQHVAFKAPLIYQERWGQRHRIQGNYKIEGNEVSFEVKHYETSHPLVIDPVLEYSTYLGGSDSDSGYGIDVDSSDNAYITGATSSSNFPTTSGTYQTTLTGTSDVFVAKLNTAGTALIYSTYIGGNAAEIGNNITVDDSGNVYLTGATRSTDFPTIPGAFQISYGGGYFDVFVTKLNATGTALIYSTYLGGSGDELGHGVKMDGSGNAYLVGNTTSSDFPTTPGAFQTIYGGGMMLFRGDAFVTKLNNTGTGLVYSTYLGGSNDEYGSSILLDEIGNAYLIGETRSTNFPTTSGAYQTAYGGSCDAFVSKLNSAGTTLLYSTYLGGSGDDTGCGIAMDGSGNVYVAGFTNGLFPATTGAFQTTFGGGWDIFVAELNATGTALVYSTYLGGSGEEWIIDDFSLDGNGNTYVTGMTGSADFPTTSDAFQTTYGGGIYDAFISKLNNTGSALLFSTYLGGSELDQGCNIALDGSENVYVTGYTGSADFPTTDGALQTNFGGGTYDAFLVKFGFSATPTPTATVSSSPLSNCGDFFVSQNRFNPSQGPVTLLMLTDCLSEKSPLKIYNSVGEHIRSLDLPTLPTAGPVTLTWDGTNKANEPCASGLYILLLTESSAIKTKRILLIH